MEVSDESVDYPWLSVNGQNVSMFGSHVVDSEECKAQWALDRRTAASGRSQDHTDHE